jgi:nucleotide-binding universal stress UspA family protein
MYDVLIGIDNAEDNRAVAQAEAIADIPAEEDSVTAHLCHVFQENPEGASVHQISAVRRARETLEEAGINCVHYEASGDPTDELLAAADDIDADAICVSGRKRRPTGKAVFGSVTQDIILGADRPIFAVPAPRAD